MKKGELNKLLSDNFKEFFKKFDYRKTKYRYKKDYNNFVVSIGFAIADYCNVFPITFGYNLSSKVIDKIFSAIFDKHISESIIIGENTISLYEKQKYHIPEYDIKTENDVKIMFKEVTEYMKSVAFPYIESICDIEILDKIINKNPQEPLFGLRGLVLSKLAKSPNYEELKKTYRQLFVERNWAVQEDIDNLEKVIDFLDSHTKEELEKIAEM